MSVRNEGDVAHILYSKINKFKFYDTPFELEYENVPPNAKLIVYNYSIYIIHKSDNILENANRAAKIYNNYKDAIRIFDELCDFYNKVHSAFNVIDIVNGYRMVDGSIILHTIYYNKPICVKRHGIDEYYDSLEEITF
jgi:hypothetical protein